MTMTQTGLTQSLIVRCRHTSSWRLHPLHSSQRVVVFSIRGNFLQESKLYLNYQHRSHTIENIIVQVKPICWVIWSKKCRKIFSWKMQSRKKLRAKLYHKMTGNRLDKIEYYSTPYLIESLKTVKTTNQKIRIALLNNCLELALDYRKRCRLKI